MSQNIKVEHSVSAVGNNRYSEKKNIIIWNKKYFLIFENNCYFKQILPATFDLPILLRFYYQTGKSKGYLLIVKLKIGFQSESHVVIIY